MISSHHHHLLLCHQRLVEECEKKERANVTMSARQEALKRLSEVFILPFAFCCCYWYCCSCSCSYNDSVNLQGSNPPVPLRASPSDRARFHTRPFSAPVSASQVRVEIKMVKLKSIFIDWWPDLQNSHIILLLNPGRRGVVSPGSLLHGASSGNNHKDHQGHHHHHHHHRYKHHHHLSPNHLFSISITDV